MAPESTGPPPEPSHAGDVHRTSLSWTRSSLELVIVALLLARVAASRDRPLVAMVALFAAVFSAATARAARRRAEWSARTGLIGDGRLPLAVVGVTVLVAVAGMLLVFIA